jgi:hypothetical protein
VAAKHAGEDLVQVVNRFGGPSRWARELGLALRHRRGHRWTAETTELALENLLAGRSTWPNQREFAAAGLAGLYQTITRTEGHDAMAARHGLPLQRPWRQRTAPMRWSADAREQPATLLAGARRSGVVRARDRQPIATTPKSRKETQTGTAIKPNTTVP